MIDKNQILEEAHRLAVELGKKDQAMLREYDAGLPNTAPTASVEKELEAFSRLTLCPQGKTAFSID